MSDWQPQSTKGNLAQHVAPALVVIIGMGLFFWWGLTL